FAGIAQAEPAEAGQCYALLVGGLGGNGPYSRWYADWIGRFKTNLTQSANVPEANIVVLSESTATADAVTASLAKFSGQVKPRDQFILFFVGHGEIGGPEPTLILPGPDLTASRLAAALKKIPARNQAVLNFSASSGDFLKPLAAPARVNLTATSPTEAEEPIFAEFFLRGLESKRAGASPDGPITLLAAYNWAALRTVLWIARWKQMEGKTPGEKPWKASGKETVEIFEKLYAGVSSRKLDASSDRNAEDAAVDPRPPGGQVTKEWIGRRVIDEHALLEDCGKEVGVGVLGEKEFQPIVGAKPGDPGYLAAHTVLGKPVLLPQP
ncbi:MAG: hypothetical protein PHQ12_14610, partial [Chthoniobacteraceae bacterium]|nr:hypothetical protein [Chthoniobacteraceae bacterium]